MKYDHLTDAQLCLRVRNKLGLTQQAFGVKLGYKRLSAGVSINRIENGLKQLPDAKWKLVLMYAGESVPNVRGKNNG